VGGVLTFLGLYVLNPAGLHDGAWFHGSRLVIEAFGLLLAALALPDPRRTWRWTSRALVLAACGVAAWGLLQQQIGYVRLVEEFGYTYGSQVRQTASGSFRSFGTLDDPFNYAALLLISLVVLTVGWRPPRWLLPLAALLVAGILVSYVRTSLVLLAPVGALVLVQRRQVVSAVALFVACVLGASLVLALVPQTSATQGGTLTFLTTLNGRTDSWSRLLERPAALPAGQGVGEAGTGAARSLRDAAGEPEDEQAAAVSTTESFTRLNVDSSYLATVYDVGLVGLLLLLAIAPGSRSSAWRPLAAARPRGGPWPAWAWSSCSTRSRAPR
jgi:hypothetical protein